MKPDYRGPWVAIYHKTAHSETFLSLTCNERSIFLQSFLLAARSEYDCIYHGKTYHLLPGQFVTTLKDLANACGHGCTVWMVRQTIDKLKTASTWAHRTAYTSAQAPSLITFINWGLYQQPYEKSAHRTAIETALEPHTEGIQSQSSIDGFLSNIEGTLSLDTQTRLVKDSVVTQKRMNQKVPLLTFDPSTQSVVGELEEAKQRFAAAFPRNDFDMVMEKMRVWIVKKGNPHKTYWKTLCTIASGEVPMKKMSDIGKSNMGEEWG